MSLGEIEFDLNLTNREIEKRKSDVILPYFNYIIAFLCHFENGNRQ